MLYWAKGEDLGKNLEASHLGMPLDYVLLGGLVCIFNRNNGPDLKGNANETSVKTQNRGEITRVVFVLLSILEPFLNIYVLYSDG